MDPHTGADAPSNPCAGSITCIRASWQGAWHIATASIWAGQNATPVDEGTTICLHARAPQGERGIASSADTLGGRGRARGGGFLALSAEAAELGKELDDERPVGDELEVLQLLGRERLSVGRVVLAHHLRPWTSAARRQTQYTEVEALLEAVTGLWRARLRRGGTKALRYR